MHVELYEKIWMALAAVLIVVFLGAITLAAGSHAIHPPSHLETIDPLTVRTDSEFSRPGVYTRDDGSVEAIVVSQMFTFQPDPMVLPAGKPVKFRLTSPDVLHGFQVVGTNANVMVVPGYVSEFTLTFEEAGEYLVVCNEYCGLSHHLMQGRLIVEESGS